MNKEKELTAITMLSDPGREKVCRKAQKAKKKLDFLLTPKEFLLTITASIMVVMVMYWSGCFM